MKTYNKLVRDKIPEVIAEKGETYKIHTADENEYWLKLVEKISEEAKEILTDGNPKEDIADILEVIDAIVEFQKFDWEEIHKIKKEKAEQRGGFSKRIILEES